MLSNFVQLSYLIYERTPNEKRIYYIVSRLRETRGSSDHVVKLQKLEKSQRNKEIHPLEGKCFLKIKSRGRGVLKIS